MDINKGKRHDSTAMSNVNRGKTAAPEPHRRTHSSPAPPFRITTRRPPRAHTRLCRDYSRPNAAFRRPAVHYPIMSNIASPRQRGQTPYAEAALRPRPASPFLRRSRRRTKPALPEKIGEGGLFFMRAYFFSASQSMVSSLLLRERKATMRSGSSVWRDISARSST